MSDKIHFSPGPSMPFVPGVVVDGKYRLERPIGRGGMGFIVLGRHVQLDQPVAVKFMHAWLAHTVPKGAARFLDEARAAACLQSDHVARVSDTGTFQGSPYMVMEYLEGDTLEALLQRQPVLPVALAVRYALQACEGLAEAHAAGIVHRDLKPANLFVARQHDGSVRIKLLDFGISKMVGGVKGPNPAWDASDPAEAEEMNGALCGSPLYMAPEQMLSSSRTDPRTDVWALGVVLYEMLVGVRPFLGETLAELCSRVMDPRPESLRTMRPEIPVVLESAVMQCLQKDPGRRFQNISALAHALASAWPGGTRVAAARIDRIAHGRRTRTSRPDPSEVAALVPGGELTNTSFNRVVDGLADLMKVRREQRGPERTPPPVAAEVIEVDEPDIVFRSRTWSRALELASRVKRATLRRSAHAPLLDPGVTRPSALMTARIGKRRVGMGAAIAAGLAAVAFFFVARATPSQPLEVRVPDPPASAAAGRAHVTPVVDSEPWKPVAPPVTAPPAESWSPTAPASARPRVGSAPTAPRPSASSSRAAPANRAAPVGTTGFGGRE